MANTGLNQVGAFGQQLHDGVRRVVHHVGVVACTANQRIATRPTVERVVTSPTGQGVGGRVADQDVHQRVAGTVDGGDSRQSQVIHVGRQGMADAGLNQVSALGRQFHHGVRAVVHHVCIVARPSNKGIGVGTAVDCVVAGAARQGIGGRVAGQDVRQRVAGTVDACRSGQNQVFYIAGQGVAHAGLNQVRAFGRQLHNGIRGVVHHIDVIACATRHGVRTGTAIERIVSRQSVHGIPSSGTGQRLRAGSAIDNVGDVQAEAGGCHGTGYVSCLDLNGQDAGSGIGRRAREDPGGRVEAEPGGQGQAVGQFGAQGQDVAHVSIREGACRHGVGIGPCFDRLLVCRRKCQDRRHIPCNHNAEATRHGCASGITRRYTQRQVANVSQQRGAAEGAGCSVEAQPRRQCSAVGAAGAITYGVSNVRVVEGAGRYDVRPANILSAGLVPQCDR